MKMKALLTTLGILAVTAVILSIISAVLVSKINSEKPASEETATDTLGHRQDKKAIVESAPRVIGESDYSKDTEDGLLLN